MRIYWAVFAWVGGEQVTLAERITKAEARQLWAEAKFSGEYDEVEFIDMVE